MSILRVVGIANDVVDRFATHERMRHACFTVKHRAKIPKLPDQFTLEHPLLASVGPSLKCIYPADVAHVRLDTFDMKLILQADRQSVQRPRWSLVSGIVCIEPFRVLDSCIEEYLMQTVDLVEDG